jgi:uncharacterized membrane protein YuzA (DUF378 family)
MKNTLISHQIPNKAVSSSSAKNMAAIHYVLMGLSTIIRISTVKKKTERKERCLLI